MPVKKDTVLLKLPKLDIFIHLTVLPVTYFTDCVTAYTRQRQAFGKSLLDNQVNIKLLI